MVLGPHQAVPAAFALTVTESMIVFCKSASEFSLCVFRELLHRHGNLSRRIRHYMQGRERGRRRRLAWAWRYLLPSIRLT